MAAEALQQVLDNLTTSPLTQLAQQVVANVRHILRSSWRWLRRKQEDAMMSETRTQMATAWGDLSAYFAQVAGRYERQLEELHIARLQENLVIDAASAETAVSPASTSNEPPDG